ncbi:beta-propeller fold lactonase family protein [Aeromonas rivipollensis]|uniref:Beta-propeller fold lactonase family protein n=1 Tax=Aeromonas rivipollensis TaxID=948519 RepID=A0AAW9Y7P4_9GAMM|nr:beta-propeller fold lactonase family protein [Aeromonas rivipollensis]NEX74386.1 beta-propeller fold lactonase family protein [Aeromonas rivipollensis]
MEQVVYVANPVSGLIHVFRLEEGELAPLQQVQTGGEVQPLVISPDKNWLYAGVRPDFRVLSYPIAADGRLGAPSSAPLYGSASHSCTDGAGRLFFAASYAFDHVSVSPMDEAGRVLAPHQRIDRLMAAHSVTLLTTEQGEQELLVACLKEDVIRRFTLGEDGQLSPHPLGDIHTAPGAGPRHLALHPTNGDLYCLNELDATLNRYHREADGHIGARESLDMLPEGYQGERWGADIHLTPDGRFLYTSERASSLLSLFGVDEEDGALTLLGHFPTESCPRGFAIDHSGHYLIATGQKSHSLAVHRIAAQTGELSLSSRQHVGEGAMWVRVLTLDKHA